ncbi:MAG: winged helix-turn-helix transcriptional regulator [Clostridia bacterium]|nr:winged helix-turn-helix transcriptional regulator [Clostridia bacterium]
MTESSVFRALGNERRLQLFKLTLGRPYCVQALARLTGLTESAISQQMRILRAAGLVTTQQHGYHTHFIADRQAVTAVFGNFTAAVSNTVFEPDACGCREADRECHCGKTK